MYLIILYLIILNIIYNISSLFFVISFIVWSINLLVSTLMLIQDPQNFWIRIIQLISLFFLSYMLFLKIKFLILYFT